MQRRKFLSSVGTGTVIGLAGCSGGNSNGDAGESGALVKWDYKEYSKVRFPSQSEGVYFESDDDTQYVGVQLKLTNEMDKSANFIYAGTAPEVTLFADGDNDDVALHSKSEISSLQSVSAGETVGATLLYTPPPEASNYTLEPWESAEHTFDISRDEDLEIGLIDLSDS